MIDCNQIFPLISQGKLLETMILWRTPNSEPNPGSPGHVQSSLPQHKRSLYFKTGSCICTTRTNEEQQLCACRKYQQLEANHTWTSECSQWITPDMKLQFFRCILKDKSWRKKVGTVPSIHLQQPCFPFPPLHSSGPPTMQTTDYSSSQPVDQTVHHPQLFLCLTPFHLCTKGDEVKLEVWYYLSV